MRLILLPSTLMLFWMLVLPVQISFAQKAELSEADDAKQKELKLRYTAHFRCSYFAAIGSSFFADGDEAVVEQYEAISDQHWYKAVELARDYYSGGMDSGYLVIRGKRQISADFWAGRESVDLPDAAREEIKRASCGDSNICDWPMYAAVEYGKENCGLLLPNE